VGSLFAIVFQLAGIFILSAVIALISGVFTALFSKKERRKRKILLAVVYPFVGLFSIYFTAGVGAVVVSEIKNIDIGTGDAWYVPLTRHCQLTFIDVPDTAYVDSNSATLISGISEVGRRNNKFYFKTAGGEMFSLDSASEKVDKIDSIKAAAMTSNGVVFKKAIDFYTDRRWEIAGGWLIAIGTIALLVSAMSLFITRRIVMRKWASW